LLDILHDRVRAGKVDKFLQALRDTLQGHIVNYVLTDKMIASVDVIIQSRNGVLKQIVENFLVDGLKKLTADDTNNLFATIKSPETTPYTAHDSIQLAGYAPKNSIRLYFYCSSLKALKEFRRDLSKWRVAIESFFNYLLMKDAQLGLVSVTHIYLIGYCMCEQYLLSCTATQL